MVERAPEPLHLCPNMGLCAAVYTSQGTADQSGRAQLPTQAVALARIACDHGGSHKARPVWRQASAPGARNLALLERVALTRTGSWAWVGRPHRRHRRMVADP